MDDDPDFMKDVLGQRMKNMIKDEVFLNIDNRYTIISSHDFQIDLTLIHDIYQLNCSVGSLEMLELSIVIVITTDSRIMRHIL